MTFVRGIPDNKDLTMICIYNFKNNVINSIQRISIVKIYWIRNKYRFLLELHHNVDKLYMSTGFTGAKQVNNE